MARIYDSLLLSLALSASASPAFADGPEGRDPAAGDARVGLLAGGGHDSLSFGAHGLRRFGAVEVGAIVLSSSQVLGYAATRYAAVAGMGLQTTSGFRFDALLDGGADQVSGSGSSFFGDPGVSATLWTAGARAGVSYLFGASRGAHFELGLWAFAVGDRAKTVSYEYADNGLGGAAGPVHGTKRVDASRSGVLVSLGIAVDVGGGGGD